MIVYCVACEAKWDMDYDPPECEDDTHEWIIFDPPDDEATS